MAFAKPDRGQHSSIGILAITQHGVQLALELQKGLPGSTCYAPERHRFAAAMGAVGFHGLGAVVPQMWSRHDALVCIMATGIVVRKIAPLIRHKAVDPAVVVVDEKGQFVISLLSGHLGGANRLAHRIARLIGGQAVITTASDVHDRPAIDLVAQQAGLEIENFGMVARVARALLEDETVWVFDPHGHLGPHLKDAGNLVWLAGEQKRDRREGGSDSGPVDGESLAAAASCCGAAAGIWVSEYEAHGRTPCLCLRPRNLVVGLGCNRGTPADEMITLVRDVFAAERLSLLSIRNLASIDLKADEPAIAATAQWLNRPLRFFSAAEIEGISVPNPSPLVEAHIGVPSVCEATALASAQTGEMLIPKRKTANVTLAVVRVG